MSEFEFDDVIRIAKVIVNPEQSAASILALTNEVGRLSAERDMHKRNWESTMEHRDRLSAELEEALNILKPLAYKKNVEDVNYFDLVAVTHFVEEHTEPMR